MSCRESAVTLLAEETPMADTTPQSRNHVLGVLPPSEFLEIKPHLTTVDLATKQRLAEPNQGIGVGRERGRGRGGERRMRRNGGTPGALRLGPIHQRGAGTDRGPGGTHGRRGIAAR